MKTRQIRTVKLLDAPIETSLLLPSVLAQKDLLLMGFGNRDVWSRMATKDTFSNPNFIFL